MDKTQAHRSTPSFSARRAALQASLEVTDAASREQAVTGLHARGTVHLPPERPPALASERFGEFGNWPNWGNKAQEFKQWSKSYYDYKPQPGPEPV